MDGATSGHCPMAGFVISDTGPSDSATTVIVKIWTAVLDCNTYFDIVTIQRTVSCIV